MSHLNNPCICGTGKVFSSCCGLYLNGFKIPPTCEKLMRSRFSAYALGGYGEYLYHTWLESHRPITSIAELDVITCNWVGLTVHSKSQKGDVGQVSFSAAFLDEKNNQKTMKETSQFIRKDGRWLYVSGDVSNE